MHAQRTVLARRQAMHGPLWTAEQVQTTVRTAEQIRTIVQLWAPNDNRDHWAIAWTTTDEGGEVVDGGYLQAPHVGEFPARVPLDIQRPVGAVLNAATTWRPQEKCDHSRAKSFSVLNDGRHICGYCGRTFQP